MKFFTNGTRPLRWNTTTSGPISRTDLPQHPRAAATSVSHAPEPRMPVPARFLRHVLLAVTVIGAVTVTAWLVTTVLPADEPDTQMAATHEATQAIVDEVDRVLYADRAGYRFVAASVGAVVPAERNADLIAAVDAVVPEATRSVWDRLADCESGNWDRNSQPIPGTARWDYGLTFSHGDIFEGGVNFHPRTWDAYKDPGMPNHAGQATKAQQIEIAERVLRDQGWRAWPVCSRKLGLR